MNGLLFSLLTTLFLQGAFAQAKVDLRPKARRIEDPGSATPLLYKTPAQVAPLAPAKNAKGVRRTCTDSLGMTVAEGDPAYAGCVRSFEKARLQNPNEKTPQSLGISLGK